MDGFNDPIVAGNTLVREAIQSEGFVSGTNGWRVERDGDAEFNDVTIRGDLSVSNSEGEVFVGLEGVPLGPVVRVTNSDSDTVQLGTAGFRAESGAGAGSTTVNYLTGGSPLRGSYTTTVVGEAGDFITMHLREDAAGFGEIVVNQEIVSEDPNSQGVSETWHDFSFSNGWSNFGGGYPNFRYRMLPHGYVGIEGTIKPGTTTNGTIIANIPNLYRPNNIKRLQWLELGALGFVDVNVNGDIQIYGSAGITTASFQCSFPLNSIG